MNLLDSLYQPVALTSRWVFRVDDRPAIARVVRTSLELLAKLASDDSRLQAALVDEHDPPLAVWSSARRPSMRVLNSPAVEELTAGIGEQRVRAASICVPDMSLRGPWLGFAWDEVGDWFDGCCSAVLAGDLGYILEAGALPEWVEQFCDVAEDHAVVTGYVTAGIASEALAHQSPYERAVGMASHVLGRGDEWKTLGGNLRGVFWGNLIDDADMKRVRASAGHAGESAPWRCRQIGRRWYVQLSSSPDEVKKDDLMKLGRWLEPSLVGSGIPFTADPRLGVLLDRPA